MALFPASLFMLILGNLFYQSPPNERNHLWGFRTKKAMKNDENWHKAQLEFGRYSKKFFSYTSLFSITFLTLDILSLVLTRDTLLTISLLIQTCILIVLFIYIFRVVNGKLS